jgi:oligopeptide transport system ATP-binding protein
MSTPVLLKIRDLHVCFDGAHGEVRAVRGISYDIHEREVVGIVGESGSGKSASAYAVMGLLRGTGRVTGGTVEFRGENVLDYKRESWDALRGKHIGMIFQNPMECLDPMISVGSQMREAAMSHSAMSRKTADERSKELLMRVGIGEPERVMRQYASALSGGMCQRIMIAMALIQEPELLIADEPTTSLDVTVQAQIMDLLEDIRKERNMAILFITHDMGLVAQICNTVCVMYAGKIVEKGTVFEIFGDPVHPYTSGLMKAIPNIEMDRKGKMMSIEGVPANVTGLPGGCAFHPRCAFCTDDCRRREPGPVSFGEGRYAACYLAEKEAKTGGAK